MVITFPKKSLRSLLPSHFVLSVPSHNQRIVLQCQVDICIYLRIFLKGVWEKNAQDRDAKVKMNYLSSKWKYHSHKNPSSTLKCVQIKIQILWDDIK